MDTGDVDCEALVEGQAVLIGNAYRDNVSGRGLGTDQLAIRHRQLTGTAINGEAAAGAMDKRILQARGAIRVDAGHRADRGAISHEIGRCTAVTGPTDGDRPARQCEIGRSAIRNSRCRNRAVGELELLDPGNGVGAVRRAVPQVHDRIRLRRRIERDRVVRPPAREYGGVGVGAADDRVVAAPALQFVRPGQGLREHCCRCCR